MGFDKADLEECRRCHTVNQWPQTSENMAWQGED
jgi:hypothetical protein